MIQRALITLGLTAGIVLAGTGAAQARPAVEETPYCGPGQSYTVFDVTTGGLKTTCTGEVYVPKELRISPPFRWWNVWTWGR